VKNHVTTRVLLRLPGKAAGQGCRARLPGKAAGQGCRARLPGKAAGQGCRDTLSIAFENTFSAFEDTFSLSQCFRSTYEYTGPGGPNLYDAQFGYF
jgi:hypothetical protein